MSSSRSALIGLVGGLAYCLVEPALPSASSYVLLPASGTNADGQPIQDPLTYAQIILSPGVLAPAAKAAGVELPFQSLQHRVTVTAVTNDDLQITVRAATGRQAINFANDTASEFLAYANNAAVVAGEQAQQLGAQQVSIGKTIDLLNSEIAAAHTLLAHETGNPTAAADTTSSLDLLNIDLGQEKTQSQLIGTLIITAKDSASGFATGAIELEQAQWATQPSIVRWVELSALGLLIGLFVGIIAALVRARVDSRLTRRDDIAAAAGVPVLTSVSLPRRWRSPDFGYLLDDWSPSVAESARLARLLQSLPSLHTAGDAADSRGIAAVNGTNGHGRDSTLTIVEKGLEITFALYAGDVFAEAVVVRLAAYTASLGLPVTVVVPDEVPLGHLSSAVERRHAGLETGRRDLDLVYASQAGKWDGRSLRVHILVLDKSDPGFSERAFQGPGVLGTAVLVLSAGFATREQVADAAESASYEHLRLAGVVVANPEPSDPTTGRTILTGAPLHQRLSSTTLAPSRQA